MTVRSQASPSSGSGAAPTREAERTVVTVKPWGIQYGRATTLGNTKAMAINLPIPFDAIEIGYVHMGGFGVASGVLACIASTDDIGPCDYALGTSDANLKKFVTPRLAGSEYNSLSANGWRAVTWSGAASVDVADAGANKIAIAWSDVIQCDAKPDANESGWYTLLVRVYDGAGPCSYAGMAGAAQGAQYNSEAGPAKLMFATRSGDCVTNPASWTAAMTPTYSDTPCPSIIIRAHGRNDAGARSVLFVGDSRFDTNTEEAGTKDYHNFAFEMERQCNASGRRVRAVKAATGGMASVNYWQHGDTVLSKAVPNASLYIGYTVNDGAPSAAVMAGARFRTLQHVEKCRVRGVTPVVVTAYPRGAMTAPELALLQAFEAWVAALGVLWFSPLQRYGNADGTWQTGLSIDGTNHMTQAAYAAMAADLIAYLANNGLV